MNRTEATYGQVDKLLRSLGFTCRVITKNAESRVYEHTPSGALIILPAFPEDDKVLDYHLVGVRTTLDGFGIVDPAEFASKLKKAG